MTAAGPWRWDIRNMPRDKWILLWVRGKLGDYFAVLGNVAYAKQCGYIIFAWAEINQPEGDRE